MSDCEECGARNAEFRYLEHFLCCGCMEVLVSWFMEGGQVEEPEMFSHLVPKEPS
jgi:hypothetical protein